MCPAVHPTVLHKHWQCCTACSQGWALEMSYSLCVAEAHWLLEALYCASSNHPAFPEQPPHTTPSQKSHGVITLSLKVASLTPNKPPPRPSQLSGCCWWIPSMLTNTVSLLPFSLPHALLISWLDNKQIRPGICQSVTVQHFTQLAIRVVGLILMPPHLRLRNPSDNELMISNHPQALPIPRQAQQAASAPRNTNKMKFPVRRNSCSAEETHCQEVLSLFWCSQLQSYQRQPTATTSFLGCSVRVVGVN